MLNIPNKSHFKMNEVCGLTGVKPYVLRFWETEFADIDPILSSSGQKLYQHKDIEAVAIIKKMLFDDKLTIEQAKAELTLRLRPSLAEEAMEQEDHELSSLDSGQVSRMQLSESDIVGLEAAKKHLRQMLHVAEDLKQRHQWS